MLFSLLKHYLDTDTALKVSQSVYCFTTSIFHGVDNYFPRLWGTDAIFPNLLVVAYLGVPAGSDFLPVNPSIFLACQTSEKSVCTSGTGATSQFTKSDMDTDTDDEPTTPPQLPCPVEEGEVSYHDQDATTADLD